MKGLTASCSASVLSEISASRVPHWPISDTSRAIVNAIVTGAGGKCRQGNGRLCCYNKEAKFLNRFKATYRRSYLHRKSSPVDEM